MVEIMVAMLTIYSKGWRWRRWNSDTGKRVNRPPSISLEKTRQVGVPLARPRVFELCALCAADTTYDVTPLSAAPGLFSQLGHVKHSFPACSYFLQILL